MARDNGDWYQRLEGIVHSYKQHIDVLEADTVRDETPRGNPILRVPFEIYKPGHPTPVDEQRNIMDSKRALFVRRLDREENVYISRLGDGYLTLAKR